MRGISALRETGVLLCWLGVAILLSTPLATAQMAPGQPESQPEPAAPEPAVQEVTGHLSINEMLLYRLADLKRGQTLHVFLERTGGNLDPLVALLRPEVEFDTLRIKGGQDLDETIAAGKDPLVEIPAIFDRYTLAWDDDSGEGDAAFLEYEIPADRDYDLLVRGRFLVDTFGAFRLLIGLDAPEVSTGDATATGAKIAELAAIDEPSERGAKAISMTTGTLTPQNSPLFFALEPIRTGETLQAYVETVSGDLKPILFLADNAGKPIRSSNFAATESTAKLTYTFTEQSRNYQIRLSSVPRRGKPTSGTYRLTVGIDAPEVLTGDAEARGEPVLRQPIAIRVGLNLHQIADVDQKAERYDAVYDLVMRWQDPELSYRPLSPEDSIRFFRQEEFVTYAKKNSVIVPSFTLYNQQERRWPQNRMTIVMPDGRAVYFERFWARLQAPDFQFAKFPFDTQRFFARIDMVLPLRYFVLEELEQYSRVGTALGEEEWVVGAFETAVTEVQPQGGSPKSSFSFIFYAHRHLNYYVLRIFLPVFAIIVISWVTFFLKDYAKRIELAGANLLVFIAFNFTIAGDLPRLGYLTVMDVVLISTFLITSIVLIVCVCLRHLEDIGRETLARRLDRYLIWLYPAAYLTVGGIMAAMLMG